MTRPNHPIRSASTKGCALLLLLALAVPAAASNAAPLGAPDAADSDGAFLSKASPEEIRAFIDRQVSSRSDAASALQRPAEEARNLELSSHLERLIATPSQDGLVRGIELAHLTTMHQAESEGLSLDVPDGPRHERPSQAFLDLTSREGAHPTAEQATAILALDAISEPLRTSLTDLVDAFLGYSEATRAASAGSGVGSLLAAREHLLDASAALRDAADETASATAAVVCSPLVVAPAFALDLESCDNLYTADVFFSLDLGGSDVYHTNAGGADLTTIASGNVCGGFAHLGLIIGASALVDLGEQDDQYGDPANPRCGGANGGAGWGAGFLLDDGGDDAYVAGDVGTNGGSYGSPFFGVGFLLDANGSDSYTAGDLGTNGGLHNAGAAMLLDISGNDTYNAGSSSANGGCGSLGGGAILLDVAGNDVYLAGDHETNGGGAHAFLLDAGGNDRYEAGNYGTNGGSDGNPGGFLRDVEGDDQYVAGDYGTNGGGVRLGAGFLFDSGGDDLYRTGGHGTNGGGGSANLTITLGTNTINVPLDGQGFLLDTEGDDTYIAADYGTNGGGSEGIGLLVDTDGNDTYTAGDYGTNGGGYDLGSGSLVDLAGDDAYTADDYGTNGGGNFDAIGSLVDLQGDDTYSAGGFGSNGGGQFFGAGSLLDATGDDVYTAGSFGTNGGADTDSKGSLVDALGNDAYHAGDGGTNGGVESGAVGLLLDGGGIDTYQALAFGTNGGGLLGFLIDAGGTGDTYSDQMLSCNGSGTDRTVVPKCQGAQIDLPLP